MAPYQWTAAVMGVSIGVVILWLVRRAHLHGPYAIWWIVVAAGVVLAGLFPQAVDVIGSMLGVSYPPVLALLVALAVLLVKVLTMDLERTRQELALRRLTQRLAMLEAELQPRGLSADAGVGPYTGSPDDDSRSPAAPASSQRLIA
jgi:hypothetical protein